MRVEKIFREENGAVGLQPNQVVEKLWRLTEILKSLADDKFTGYIKVNYSQGAIGRVEKFEEILKK
ncbi:MAG: hypothetical protein JXL84_24320 [Deltaproteobacteria bacterium]|nr:hypothetical protein [Deltaproteobacteria bacterium]